MQMEVVQFFLEYFINHCLISTTSLPLNYTQEVSVCETGHGFPMIIYKAISQFEDINIFLAHYRIKKMMFKL